MEKEEYEKIKAEIWYHNKRYYADHDPEISDEQYDLLFRRLEDAEAEHPEWKTADSPTQRVGEAVTDGFQTVQHTTPMLSLSNTYSREELEDFVKRIKKLLERENLTFSAELKMDGIAVSIRYENGVFCRGVTRGNGREGDDITTNIKTIKALPLRLHGDGVPDAVEVRGEVFMPRETFASLNEQRIALGDAPWANPRNAAAGSLKLLDPKEVSRRDLHIVLYSVVEDSSAAISSQYESHGIMRQWGLPILTHIAKCHSIDEILAFAEKVHTARSSLPFDIDGIVVKVDSIRDQDMIGITGKNPRWAVAYKFAAEKEITRINDITVQVGRTGVLTPVAELELVVLAGSSIARATLHNEDEVRRKDIRIGDTVVIEKGGDVIPKVVEVDTSARPSDSKPWVFPETCPSCGTPVQRQEGEVAVRCPNVSGCGEQQLRRIIFFASKHAMDIENLGEKVVEQLVEKGFVRRVSDIYSLTAEQLYQLEGFKEKAVENLLRSIDESRHVSLERFIMALAIKYVGAGTAELLANRAGNVETLAEMTQEELLEIDGVGEKVAASVVAYFSDAGNQEEIAKLLGRGVRPKKVAHVSHVGHPFYGKSFVLTGSLENYTRTAAASLIKERGGKVVNAVSKKTDYVLAGESAGSKLEKARKLGISVLTEKEFVAML